MMFFRPSSVRVRLTLWYTAALACVLAAYAVTVFLFVRHALYGGLDRDDAAAAQPTQCALAGLAGGVSIGQHVFLHMNAGPSHFAPGLAGHLHQL